jgi:hypothetical protein
MHNSQIFIAVPDAGLIAVADAGLIAVADAVIIAVADAVAEADLYCGAYASIRMCF